MARPKKATKPTSRKNVKTAVPIEVPAASDESETLPKSSEGRVRTPSSAGKESAASVSESRVGSMSLNDLASRQLLGELEASLNRLDD